MLGNHDLTNRWSTQPVHALSVAEAEYYAMAVGATRCLGKQTMRKEMGVEVGVVMISTESSSANSFASRRGLGKMRHIEVKELWLQEAVCRGKIKLYKVLGTKNPADMFTKYLPQEEVLKHLSRLSIRLR